MKQILIISGKGGTGKTIIAASFAAIANNKVTVDCDVDAADLHILLKPLVKNRYVFRSGKTAVINKKSCTYCGDCRKVCRFDAIKEDFIVDSISCEGCEFCSLICPKGAIEMQDNETGEWFVSDTKFGPMVHAKLGIAEENSGKLVSLVRNKAKEIAKGVKLDWIIIDGPPGIGCPVIASLSGVDIAVVITEPSISGLHDADRVIQLARHFDVPVKLIINKYDLNLDMAEKIEQYCEKNRIELLGKIAFDEKIVEAMIACKIIVEYAKNATAQIIDNIWRNLEQELK